MINASPSGEFDIVRYDASTVGFGASTPVGLSSLGFSEINKKSGKTQVLPLFPYKYSVC